MGRTQTTLLLLSAAILAGCAHDAPPPPSAAEAKLPTSVDRAFHKEHPSVAPAHVRARLFPDNLVHYEVRYVDANGEMQRESFLPDGTREP